ncbi:MAG: hypothetical protein Q9226_008393, partial [Calogaya cf. arnoldii]
MLKTSSSASSDYFESPRTSAILDIHANIRSKFPNTKIAVFSKYLKYLRVPSKSHTESSITATMESTSFMPLSSGERLVEVIDLKIPSNTQHPTLNVKFDDLKAKLEAYR